MPRVRWLSRFCSFCSCLPCSSEPVCFYVASAASLLSLNYLHDETNCNSHPKIFTMLSRSLKLQQARRLRSFSPFQFQGCVQLNATIQVWSYLLQMRVIRNVKRLLGIGLESHLAFIASAVTLKDWFSIFLWLSLSSSFDLDLLPKQPSHLQDLNHTTTLPSNWGSRVIKLLASDEWTILISQRGLAWWVWGHWGESIDTIYV